MSRLCSDYPLLSLTRAPGILLWKVVPVDVSRSFTRSRLQSMITFECCTLNSCNGCPCLIYRWIMLRSASMPLL